MDKEILSSVTPPHDDPNLYGFLSFVRHKTGYQEKGLTFFGHKTEINVTSFKVSFPCSAEDKFCLSGVQE